MPICKQCGLSFPNRYEKEGREYRIGRRKYCFTCHPEHYCKPHPTGLLACRCETCGREYLYNRSGCTTKTCNSCLVNRHRWSRKKKCIEYKGGACSICGYSKCAEALTFHHLNPEEKSFEISGSHTRKWEVVKTELDKCILLCQNCHHELHAK